VREVITMARIAYGDGEVDLAVTEQGPHESAWLALDAAKARDTLGVRPHLTLAEAIGRTMTWYCAHRDRRDALSLCRADIEAFETRLGDEAVPSALRRHG
jgi:CDP-glucose 4,6-dehydratase